MFKNNVNYKNLFKTLGLGGALLFASCDKTENENECNDPYNPSCGNYNPKLAQIDALRTDSTRLAGEVRAAVEPAKTDPDDISSIFDNTFFGEIDRDNKVPPKTLPDSAKILIRTIETLRNQFGNPLPVNHETTTDLYNKSNAYIVTIAELQKLR